MTTKGTDTYMDDVLTVLSIGVGECSRLKAPQQEYLVI